MPEAEGLLALLERIVAADGLFGRAVDVLVQIARGVRPEVVFGLFPVIPERGFYAVPRAVMLVGVPTWLDGTPNRGSCFAYHTNARIQTFERRTVMKSPVYDVFDIQRMARAKGRVPRQAMHIRIATLCAVLVVAAACTGERSGGTATDGTAGQTETTTSAPTITSPAGPAPADDQPPEVATADALYLIQALQQGMGHIELAQAVSSRSESPVVDDVARRIIETHNGINGQLATIAAQASVTLANDAAPELRQTIARLEPLTGRNLDAAYLAAILQTYPELVRLHGAAATTATDMDVKTAAVRARSLLEGNLTEARRAYAQVTGTELPPQPESGSPPPASATPPR